jgi:hypothetical protein
MALLASAMRSVGVGAVGRAAEVVEERRLEEVAERLVAGGYLRGERHRAAPVALAVRCAAGMAWS